MNLSELEKEFLKEQNIPLILTFDASGCETSEYEALMKNQNKIIAFNTSPCETHGHRLRTRIGDCIQCDTAKIALMKKDDDLGTVYIIGSVEGRIIKIGMTQNALKEKTLNAAKYGGRVDWKVLFSVECVNAGKLELMLQEGLSKYGVSLKLDSDDHLQFAPDLFNCSYAKAKEQLDEILNNGQIHGFNGVEKTRQIKFYKFRNLVRPT